MRTRGPHGLDSIVVVYYRGKELVYVARVRNGFVPASRRQLFEKLKLLVISKCPFVNLPEKYRPRWGERMTVDEMNKCVWVKPKLVAQIEFLEWTDADHLRHSKFVGLREDKNAQKTVGNSPQNFKRRGVLGSSVPYVCGVEMWCGGLGAAYLLPAPSAAGASIASPCFRFPIPLIETTTKTNRCLVISTNW